MCGVAGRIAGQGPLRGGGYFPVQGSPLEHRFDVSRLDQGQLRLPSPRRKLGPGDYDYDYDYEVRKELRCARLFSFEWRGTRSAASPAFPRLPGLGRSFWL